MIARLVDDLVLLELAARSVLGDPRDMRGRQCGKQMLEARSGLER